MCLEQCEVKSIKTWVANPLHAAIRLTMARKMPALVLWLQRVISNTFSFMMCIFERRRMDLVYTCAGMPHGSSIMSHGHTARGPHGHATFAPLHSQQTLRQAKPGTPDYLQPARSMSPWSLQVGLPPKHAPNELAGLTYHETIAVLLALKLLCHLTKCSSQSAACVSSRLPSSAACLLIGVNMKMTEREYDGKLGFECPAISC